MRSSAAPHVFDLTISGVSENQNVLVLPDAEARRAIQDRGILTTLAAIAAADADHSILGQRRQDLVDLKVQGLLQPDDVGVLRFQQGEQLARAAAPSDPVRRWRCRSGC